ncbi:hypothetical protein K0M31_013005 [Melipona bicolor]|uniref:Uncharacterized protein n=1 Tax=Melipona bicolor TaxID=60889 RepID=A0AA40FJC9_9HYME|nr:hypothetical protein K0M31_013005 [Melipona bicolor]
MGNAVHGKKLPVPFVPAVKSSDELRPRDGPNIFQIFRQSHSSSLPRVLSCASSCERQREEPPIKSAEKPTPESFARRRNSMFLNSGAPAHP